MAGVASSLGGLSPYSIVLPETDNEQTPRLWGYLKGGEEMAGGSIVGPGGTVKSGKMTGYNTKGPGGVAGSNTSYTTSKGYEGGRTMGTRKEYKSSGMASNSKAGKGMY